MCKGTKITSRVDSYKTIKRWVKKQSTGAGSSVAKQPAIFHRLRIFATLQNFHLALFLFSIFALNFPWLDHASSNSARVHFV